MSDFRNGQNLDGEHLKAQRKRYVGQADAFVADHSSRLGISPAELRASVCRGWLPEDIERLPSSMASHLSRTPIFAALAAAPVLPIVRDNENMEHRRERQVASALKEKAA